MMKKIICLLIGIFIISSGAISIANTTDPVYYPSTKANVTIYVNTSAIDNRNDLTSAQKTALKNRIIQHLKDNYEDAVGAANVTITNDPSQANSAGRTIQIQPGKDPSRPKRAAWGAWPHKSNTTYVYLGEFMDDSSVNGSFKNADGTWNTTKLGNAIGHTSGHEVGHSYSIGHNHKERPKNPADNRSKMTVGSNLNSTERANAAYKFDKHSKDVLKKNWGKGACDSSVDYDEKILITHFWDDAIITDKPDEGKTFDAIFYHYAEIPGWYEFGFLGYDTDNGVYDGNPNFDFVYKSSLLMDDTDAEIISFLDGHHGHTTWLLRGTEVSPWPGEWIMLNPDNVILEEFIVNPDGDEVARYATLVWPDHSVFITFDSYSFGDESCPFNGFTYEFYDPISPDDPIITGPTSGKPGIDYIFTFSSVDLNGEDIYYYINWGDGETEEWIGPYESGEEIDLIHSWDSRGTYIIKAKARDEFNFESDWSTHEVSIPRNRLLIQDLIIRILERFPNAFPILRQLIGL